MDRNRKKWTDEELNIIREYYLKLPIEEVAEMLPGRAVSAIKDKAPRIGLQKHPIWTDEDIDLLKEYYPTATKSEMIEMFPNRDISSIHIKASKLGLKKDVWLDEDVKKLQQLFNSGKSIKEITLEFDGKYSKSAIGAKTQKLGLHFRTYWTKEEEQIMLDHYPIEPIDNFIHLLNNRTRDAVIGKAVNMQLKSYLTWSKKDEQFLIENWELMSDYELSIKLNKSQLCVKKKRQTLKLFRLNKDVKNYENIIKFVRSNNSIWKNKSMMNCNYCCIVTGSKKFEIHHLVNVSSMMKEVIDNVNIEYKDFCDYTQEELDLILQEFLKVQNKYPLGVCISKDIHVLYHSLYKQTNNNPEQFWHFIDNYKNGMYNEYIKNKEFMKSVETA